MSTPNPDSVPKKVEDITTLEEAKARIVALEEKIDEAIDVIMRRDADLEATERRAWELEQQLASARKAAQGS